MSEKIEPHASRPGKLAGRSLSKNRFALLLSTNERLSSETNKHVTEIFWRLNARIGGACSPGYCLSRAPLCFASLSLRLVSCTLREAQAVQLTEPTVKATTYRTKMRIES